jgi:geranylgeranyl reductase family protein
MTYDVIVAGAGPAGTAAARECARLGLATLCLEEHGTIGHPVQCTGLLSESALEECRVSDRSVLNRVTGARVISGAGSELVIDANRTKAYVVDRGGLDREMAGAAADAGAEIRLKTAVTGVAGDRVMTRGAYGHEEIPFRILIAADGPRSTIARKQGMEQAKTVLSGIQTEIPYESSLSLVDIYPDASPEFFGWMVPTGKGRARVGLCGRTTVTDRFSRFLARFGTSSSVHLVTGALPLGVMPRTYGKRTLYVGDAAGFAKPTSGGGVYTGIRSARHAASTAALCCEQDRYDDRFLDGYEQRWHEDFGRELETGFRLYHLRQKMTPEEIDGVIRALADPRITAEIVRYGDMDRPGKILGLLIRKPAILKCLGPLLSCGLRSFF